MASSPSPAPAAAPTNPKIAKIITRLQSKITPGMPFEAQYEAAQETRLVAARYTKSQNYTAAIDILSSVSQSLLKTGPTGGGSGGDLAILLVDVYKQAGLKVDATSKGRVLTCLRLFDPAEPNRKKFVKDVVEWSKKYSDYPAGDPELHHVIGSMLAEEKESLDEAERHLILGTTKDSPPVLAQLEYEWYKQDETHTAPLYCARAVLPYLLMANLKAATTCYKVFTSQLAAENPSLAAQDVGETKIFPSLPLMNFLGLLIVAVQKGNNPEVFRQLKGKYMPTIKEATDGVWDTALELIGEMYFGIQRPRQSNPLFDMMGSFLGMPGGGGGSGGRPMARRVEAAPAAEGLD
ncbi:hypothetical protein QC764_210470 [Podospora pseudoanserina]|uniref:Uncharacterized protein n=1 Tax=Podospora pseudoanserina TaxID=2609844 RepID=A0ABR0IID5_9PEZI|nr:hypothetical protein QC764_210470 [Podospora pseudoanserina]